MQERLEASTAGRTAISLFVATTVAALVVTGLPDSPIEDVLDPFARPYTDAVGLDQNWEVFAPDPRSVTIAMDARVTFAADTTAVWRPPGGGRLVDTYRLYRWRKWVENVRADANAGELWEPTARWIARLHERDGREVQRVTLVRYWREIPPPGSGEPTPPWRSHEFYVLELP